MTSCPTEFPQTCPPTSSQTLHLNSFAKEMHLQKKYFLGQPRWAWWPTFHCQWPYAACLCRFVWNSGYPFWSLVTTYLPCEHPLVKHDLKSFGDWFVEGTYLRADYEMPCIRMCCIALWSILLVQDFKAAHQDEFPIRWAGILRVFYDAHWPLQKIWFTCILIMHTMTKWLLKKLSFRSQARAAQAIQTVVEPTSSRPLQDVTEMSVENPNESAIASRFAYGSTRATDETAHHDDHDLTDFSKFAIARALLKHSVEFILLPYYKSDDACRWRGCQKVDKSKAVLMVKFLSPQTLKHTPLQTPVYCTCLSLEPKHGLYQGADLISSPPSRAVEVYTTSLHIFARHQSPNLVRGDHCSRLQELW